MTETVNPDGSTTTKNDHLRAHRTGGPDGGPHGPDANLSGDRRQGSGGDYPRTGTTQPRRGAHGNCERQDGMATSAIWHGGVRRRAPWPAPCPHFSLRCDAIGLHKSEILLLSVVGPETSVKALTAGLRSSGKDQKRIDYSAAVGTVNDAYLSQMPGRLPDPSHQARLRPVACPVPGQARGFHAGHDRRRPSGSSFKGIPSRRRSCSPWTARLMQAHEGPRHARRADAKRLPGRVVLADSDMLDRLVSEGIRHGDLAIDGQQRT